MMNFNPNQEQIKSAIRWLITAFGMGAAGWFAHSGYITQAQVMDIFNSPTFMTIAVAVVSGIFGLLNHTQANAVAVVSKIAADPASPVAGVITTDTVEGRALAKSIPTAEIAPANSIDANSISKGISPKGI